MRRAVAISILVALALWPAGASAAGEEFPKGFAGGTAISGFQSEPSDHAGVVAELRVAR